MRTGVVQPLPGIGDMIWYVPALRAIAQASPDKKITLFTRPSVQAKAVFAAEPMIADIVYLPIKKRGAAAVLPNFFSTWQALRRSRPDRLFILHQSIRYRLAARLAGIREIITYSKLLASSKENGWEKSLSFLKQQNIPVANHYSQLAVDPLIVDIFRQRYHSYPQPWIAIAPGASTEARLWPVERFAVCADDLTTETKGTVFIIGSAKEAIRVESVYKECRNKDKAVTVTDLSFDHVMGLISCCKFLLGNDSGPANVAAALGIQSFALCGTSVPPLHSPYQNLITPDMSKEQATGMQAISIVHVKKTLHEFLAKNQAD